MFYVTKWNVDFFLNKYSFYNSYYTQKWGKFYSIYFTENKKCSWESDGHVERRNFYNFCGVCIADCKLMYSQLFFLIPTRLEASTKFNKQSKSKNCFRHEKKKSWKVKNLIKRHSNYFLLSVSPQNRD